jgi:minor histocompatibility antigen H13
MTLLELGALLISCYCTYIYVSTKLWAANNVFAICFTIYCIENWQVGSFKHIFIIFIGLILYDAFFVFASDVMMTVAQGVDIPIKILFP